MAKLTDRPKLEFFDFVIDRVTAATEMQFA